MGEAIRSAQLAGREWGEIAAALGAPAEATTQAEVIEARVQKQRSVWQRFWSEGTP